MVVLIIWLLLHSSRDQKGLEETLSQYTVTLSAYLRTWRQKLNNAEMLTTAFHSYNQEAKREVEVYANGKLLPLLSSTIPWCKLDRSLTFCHHLEMLRKKIVTRVMLLRRLASSGWAAGAKTLRTAALCLIYSAASTSLQFGVAVHTPISLTMF